MMEEKALTYNRLVTKTQRQFKLAKDFYPNVDILIGDTGEIEISNVGEVPVTQEQLDFMLETIKANEGVYLGDGRQSFVWDGKQAHPIQGPVKPKKRRPKVVSAT